MIYDKWASSRAREFSVFTSELYTIIDDVMEKLFKLVAVFFLQICLERICIRFNEHRMPKLLGFKKNHSASGNSSW